MKNKKNRNTRSKKEDGEFPSKNINHDPQAESARVKFGNNKLG
ncbi:MAG: CPC_1213 family protein [Ruminiclostridium sp.]